jgi:hypothetical protein
MADLFGNPDDSPKDSAAKRSGLRLFKKLKFWNSLFKCIIPAQSDDEEY